MSKLLNDPDVALMVRFQQGDEDAFDALVEKFKKPVFNYIYWQIGAIDEAEDIAQNVFVQVYKSAKRYQPSAKFTTWLFTIARNFCLNEFRRRRRHPLQSLQSLQETVSSEPGSDSSLWNDPNIRSPAVEVLERELQEQVFAAIQRLPELQRTAVLLCRYEGLSHEEISQILHTSVSAIKSLLHRARKSLKVELNKYLRET